MEQSVKHSLQWQLYGSIFESVILTVLTALVISFAIPQNLYAVESEPDRFAGIALDIPAPQRGGTQEKLPPELPAIELEATTIDPSIKLPEYHVMRSTDEFRTALEQLNKQFAPFLADFSPPAPATRARCELKAFKFRMEDKQDQIDFARVWRGDGPWESVTIPHYRGPVGWWTGYYRKVLDIPEQVWAKDVQVLRFGAVSYFCDVYLNGHYIGSHTGWWAPFEFDVTQYLRRNGENVLVVRIKNEGSSLVPEENDGRQIFAATSPGWDDPNTGWHHDQSGAGIWQSCYLEGRPKIHITDIFVQPDIDAGFIDTRIGIYQPEVTHRDIEISVSIYPKNFKGTGIENIKIPTLRPAGALWSEFRGRIKLENFRLWDMDRPYLYTIRATVAAKDAKGQVDRQDIHFGMRKFTMDETHSPKGTYYFNNREIILRGANTMGHMQRAVMEGNLNQVVEDILIGKLANMNFWRLTQRPVQPEVYDLCDRLGMLTQTDLPLFGYLPRMALEEAIKQAGEMELLVRNHPCNVVISYINEPMSTAYSKMTHRQLTRQELERFFKAASQVVRIYNPDRVIKPVDGDYDPPTWGLPDNHCYCLWYDSHGIAIGKLHRGFWMPIKPGWKWGCGEYGIEGLEAAETMFKHYPKQWLPESPDDPWNPNRIVMAQTWRHHRSWFDTQNTMREWIEASQNHQARGIRMMTRAFRRQKDMGSSAVHLLIDAWPGGWMKALVDVDRNPKKSYFEYRDALTPLMVDIRTDRTRYYAGDPLAIEFWVCNDGPAPFPQGRFVYEVWQGEKRLFAQSKTVEIPSYDPKFVGFFHYESPPVIKRTELKIRLGLLDPNGQIVHASEQEVEVFPIFDKARNCGRIAAIVGNQNGRAWHLAASLGLNPRLFSDSDAKTTIVIVDNPEALEQHADVVLDFVRTGETALLLEQTNGAVWRLGDRTVRVTGITGKEFVSRKTGHRLVEGFRPFDFAYWYEPEADRIDYVLDAVLELEMAEPEKEQPNKKWQPIMVTNLMGNGPVGQGWQGENRSAPLAVAEMPLAKGSLIISQIKASSRVSCNPIAAEFYQRIIDDAAAK